MMPSSSTTTLPSLPALAKAGSEVAQNYFKYHRVAHLIALLLAILMLVLKKHDLLVYTCAVIALIAEVLAWVYRYLVQLSLSTRGTSYLLADWRCRGGDDNDGVCGYSVPCGR